ncbi:hypothetical protein ABGF49_02125 [Helcococcus ovis]|uniref:RNA-binding protein n=1 Tax=Helcococcus ovis TaxID=72026 RepID=A0A4R9C2L3_9FIRM|nr:hypothetical protein [Helcococcus ovis]TFF66235.1 hypothetical protein EQF92_00665 [Helcococcus ovis]TFF66354.1 hypothetical protein EQF93_07340 [Helcococcus ovis]TFF67286.1 hypothetical protein EQF91_01285 [Helcococcus ovis]WNZ00937.1 hypothetical protein EQF90_006625 [Helcococcus ovis]
MSLTKKNRCEFVLGQLCVSKQGRDKGKVYIVYEFVDEDYILLVNGKDKKINNPKKKNKKHLQIVNQSIEDFEKLKSIDKIDDLLIKRNIKLKLQEEA